MKKKIILLLTIVAILANVCNTNILVEAKSTKPEKTNITKLVNLSNNSVHVIFKSTYAEKYQVMYSTDKNLKKILK